MFADAHAGLCLCCLHTAKDRFSCVVAHIVSTKISYASYFIPVERYDPRTNRWTPVSPMGTRRKHLGVAVYNNMIYAVGGRDDTTELSSAERYSPQTNSWQPVVAMTSRRSGVSNTNSSKVFSKFCPKYNGNSKIQRPIILNYQII